MSDLQQAISSRFFAKAGYVSNPSKKTSIYFLIFFYNVTESCEPNKLLEHYPVTVSVHTIDVAFVPQPFWESSYRLDKTLETLKHLENLGYNTKSVSDVASLWPYFIVSVDIYKFDIPDPEYILQKTILLSPVFKGCLLSLRSPYLKSLKDE